MAVFAPMFVVRQPHYERGSHTFSFGLSLSKVHELLNLFTIQDTRVRF